MFESSENQAKDCAFRCCRMPVAEDESRTSLKPVGFLANKSLRNFTVERFLVLFYGKKERERTEVKINIKELTLAKIYNLV